MFSPGLGEPSDIWRLRQVSEHDARLIIAEGPPVAVLGLLSMVADGRVREVATSALAAQRGGNEISYLLLRVNDWVPQVSQIATNGLLSRVNRQCAPDLARGLALVESLGSKRRVNNTHLVHSVWSLLTETDEGLAALRGIFFEGDRETRRAAARLVSVRSPALALRFSESLSDSDPVVRTQLIGAALHGGNAEQLAEWVPKFLTDRMVRVRSMAFTAASARCPEVLLPRLKALLFDQNVWLREFARQAIPKAGEQDFASIYSAVILAEGPALLSAIAGIGETGNETHGVLVQPHVVKGSSKMRQTALRALCQLLGQKADLTVVAALGSELAGVSKVALELIRTARLTFVADDIVPLCRSEHAHVRTNALRALVKVGRWEALIAGLEAYADPNIGVTVAAAEILARWHSVPIDLYRGPSEAQRSRLRAAITVAPLALRAVSSTVNSILGST